VSEENMFVLTDDELTKASDLVTKIFEVMLGTELTIASTALAIAVEHFIRHTDMTREDFATTVDDIASAVDDMDGYDGSIMTAPKDIGNN